MKKHLKKILCIIFCIILAFIIYLSGYVISASKHIPPHYHANFAMYVNGERIEFSDPKYSEDIAGCSITGEIVPEDRVHLHENNGDTIHVHAAGVSWGHFFSNNNFAFGDDYIALDTGDIYKNSDSRSIKYYLNGKEKKNPFNKLIGSKDRLLIVYGEETLEQIEELYNTVSDNAGEYNAKYDPGSCGGTNESGILVILTEWIHSFHNMDHADSH